MKVLQVNCVYNTGSTGKIMYDVHKELIKQNIDSVICYGRGPLVKDANVYKTCSEFYSNVNHFFANLSGSVYGGLLLSTKKLISIIKKEQPDVVHLHCLNGYFVNIYKIIGWLKKQKIYTVLTLHAEFMYTGGCGHALTCEQWKTACGREKCPNFKTDKLGWFFDRTKSMWKKMNEAFRGFDKDKLTIVSVSPWLKSRAEQSAILSPFNHTYVLNGLDTQIFNRKNVKDERLPTNKKIILHVTPSFDDNDDSLKGGRYFKQLAERFKDNDELAFVVCGNYGNVKNCPNNMIFLGKVSNQEQLASIYSSASLTVLTSSRETFSMVTAESLCCGTPVVGFFAGGPESIAIDEFTRFLPYGDMDALYDEVVKTLNTKFDREEISLVAQEKYKRENMLQGYLSIYKREEKLKGEGEE